VVGLPGSGILLDPALPPVFGVGDSGVNVGQPSWNMIVSVESCVRRSNCRSIHRRPGSTMYAISSRNHAEMVRYRHYTGAPFIFKDPIESIKCLLVLRCLQLEFMRTRDVWVDGAGEYCTTGVHVVQAKAATVEARGRMIGQRRVTSSLALLCSCPQPRGSTGIRRVRLVFTVPCARRIFCNETRGFYKPRD
jgi:hypothetical protein